MKEAGGAEVTFSLHLEGACLLCSASGADPRFCFFSALLTFVF